MCSIMSGWGVNLLSKMYLQRFIFNPEINTENRKIRTSGWIYFDDISALLVECCAVSITVL